MKICKISFLLSAFALLICSCSNKGNSKKGTVAVLTDVGAERINAHLDRQKPSRNIAKQYNWLMAYDEEESVSPGDIVTNDMVFEVYTSDNIYDLLLIGTTDGADIIAKQEDKSKRPFLTISSPIKNEELDQYILNGDIRKGDILEYNKEAEFMIKYEYVVKGTAAETDYSCQPTVKLEPIDNECAQRRDDSPFELTLGYSLTTAEIEEEIKNYVKTKFYTKDSSLTLDVSLNKTESELSVLKEAAINSAKQSDEHIFPTIELSFIITTSNGVSTSELPLSLQLEDDVLPRLFKNNVEQTSISLEGGTIDMTYTSVFNEGCTQLAINKGYYLSDEIDGSHNTEFHFVVSENGEAQLDLLNGSLVDTGTKMKNYNQLTDKKSYHYFQIENDPNGPYVCYAFDEKDNVVLTTKYQDPNKHDAPNVMIFDDFIVNQGTVFEAEIKPSYIETLFLVSPRQQIDAPIEVGTCVLNYNHPFKLKYNNFCPCIYSNNLYFNKNLSAEKNTMYAHHAYFSGTEAEYLAMINSGQLYENYQTNESWFVPGCDSWLNGVNYGVIYEG